MQRYRKFLGGGVLGLVLWGSPLQAEEFGRYREFVLGSDVATVSTRTASTASELKTIHRRPALIQELTWRPRYAVRRQPVVGNESVEQMVFSFYNDTLYRVVVDYDREQTAGLTDADLVDAVSAVYGTMVKPAALPRRTVSPARDDLGTPIGQWGNTETVIALYRVPSYAVRFRLVVTGESMAALARTATAQALVLDAREAPQRDADLAKQEAENRRLEDEKSRVVNKPRFQP